MTDIMVLKALGGSVYSVIAYFTLQHYVYATIVTHLAVIAGGVTLSKKVRARCINCGKVSIRSKGRSGLACMKAGVYCGTMHVMELIE